MSLHCFFVEHISGNELTLDDETSRHIVQVLRMDKGERLLLTNGKGISAEGEIIDPHKKHCTVTIVQQNFTPPSSLQLTIAISLIKNTSRFEWFLEKATELGTTEIIPLICERTIREKFRHDRLLGICKSAMLQSLQSWLPVLHEPRNFSEIISGATHQQKMIAYCIEEDKRELASAFQSSLQSHIILIGPEGDFSENEITNAKRHGFIPVSLGRTRLRTETAGIYAAVICRA